MCACVCVGEGESENQWLFSVIMLLQFVYIYRDDVNVVRTICCTFMIHVMLLDLVLLSLPSVLTKLMVPHSIHISSSVNNNT